MIGDEQLVPQFVSTVFPVERWSVLEAAGAIAALAIADAERLDLLVTGNSLAEQLRAFDEDVPVLVAAGRSTRSARGRTAFARKPVAVEID
jgi:hypothetical protein